MTHDTDALVSEQTDIRLRETSACMHRNAVSGDRPLDVGLTQLLEEAADAIASLTRELGEAQQLVLNTQAVAEDYLKRAETAEAALSAARAERDDWNAAAKVLHDEAIAERDAARAELAECRNKALEEVEARLNKMATEKKADWSGEVGAEASISRCILNTIEVCATLVHTLKESPHE